MNPRTRHEAETVTAWDFSAMRAWAADPHCFDAERVVGQARLRAVFAEHDANVRAAQEARWVREELEQAAPSRPSGEGGTGSLPETTHGLALAKQIMGDA